MGASQRTIGSDLAKVDAYQNTAADYDDLPEVTDEEFPRAVPHHNGKPLRGRPRLETPKKQITLRLDQDIIDHYRREGRGWMGTLNTVLRLGMVSKSGGDQHAGSPSNQRIENAVRVVRKKPT